MDRDAMWEVMRKKRVFTLRDIQTAADHNPTTIMGFLKPLIAGGYVELKKKGAGRHDPHTYTLVRDAGKQYPRLDKKGKQLPPSDTQRIWSVIKVIGRSTFDHRDVSFVSKTDAEMARKYLRFLACAGYLRAVERESTKQLVKYVFIRARDTGPRAPELRSRHTEVYDTNTRQVVWKKGGVK